MKVVPLRLQPGDDLRRAMEAWMVEQQEQAGYVISAVGSLSVAQHHRGAGDRPAAGLAVQPGAGSSHRLPRAADQSSGSGLRGGSRRSTCRNNSPVVAQKLHDRHRAGADAQAAQQEAPKLVQLLPVHCHRLGPGQRGFRLAEGLQVASAQPADAQHHQLA
jgi:hypothetical protein